MLRQGVVCHGTEGLGEGLEDGQTPLVGESQYMSRERQEGGIRSGSGRPLPEDFAVSRIKAEKAPLPIVGQAIKKTIRHDGRGHVEGELLWVQDLETLHFPFVRTGSMA